MGVLCVLIFMMFSGANPTLDQLQHNPLLGKVLFYPSYISLFRWTQELYYVRRHLLSMIYFFSQLIEVRPYHPTAATLALYGYKFANWTSCIVGTVCLAVLFRLAAYIAIVKREE